MTLLPTRRRLPLLKNFLVSAINAKTSTPGLLLIDENDYQDNRVEYDKLLLPLKWKILVTKAVTMGDKIREAFDWKWEWVCVLNDDHEIVSENWDTKLLKKLDGTNFVTCNDRWMSPRKASGATIWSMPLVEALGFPLYPPGLTHLFFDDLHETIGKATGCWDIDHSVTILHKHPLKGQNPMDETFQATYGKDPNKMNEHPLWKADQEAYVKWVQNDLMAARNRIRKLRGQIEIVYNA